MQTPSTPLPTPRQKSGRWSQRQQQLFETLFITYGKNWKKIHQYLKRRSLGQIRSHAQKYFEKIGREKTQEIVRRARLIEAFQTLSKENYIQSERKESLVCTKIEGQSLMDQIPSSVQEIAPRQPRQIIFFPFTLVHP